jgi:hypothetical protein
VTRDEAGVSLLVGRIQPVPHLQLRLAFSGSEALGQIGNGRGQIDDLLLERALFAGLRQLPHQLVVVHAPKLVRGVRFALAT